MRLSQPCGGLIQNVCYSLRVYLVTLNLCLNGASSNNLLKTFTIQSNLKGAARLPRMYESAKHSPEC